MRLITTTMKHFFYTFIVLFAILSCKQKITHADLVHLTGYWEIEKVEQPGADDKTYDLNDTYDYVYLQNGKGYRLKVIPQMDGSLQSNQIKEELTLFQKDGETFLNYKTKYATWQEEVLVLNENEWVTKNKNGITYFYKKVKKSDL